MEYRAPSAFRGLLVSSRERSVVDGPRACVCLTERHGGDNIREPSHKRQATANPRRLGRDSGLFLISAVLVRGVRTCGWR